MREKFNPLIKSCVTRPDSYRDDPAVETKSMGLHRLRVAASAEQGRQAGRHRRHTNQNNGLKIQNIFLMFFFSTLTCPAKTTSNVYVM